MLDMMIRPSFFVMTQKASASELDADLTVGLECFVGKLLNLIRTSPSALPRDTVESTSSIPRIGIGTNRELMLRGSILALARRPLSSMASSTSSKPVEDAMRAKASKIWPLL